MWEVTNIFTWEGLQYLTYVDHNNKNRHQLKGFLKQCNMYAAKYCDKKNKQQWSKQNGFWQYMNL